MDWLIWQAAAASGHWTLSLTQLIGNITGGTKIKLTFLKFQSLGTGLSKCFVFEIVWCVIFSAVWWEQWTVPGWPDVGSQLSILIVSYHKTNTKVTGVTIKIFQQHDISYLQHYWWCLFFVWLSMWRKTSHDQTFKISKPVKISLEQFFTNFVPCSDNPSSKLSSLLGVFVIKGFLW